MQKAEAARALVSDWRGGFIMHIGQVAPHDRPKRPDRPKLLRPREMPKRRKAQSEAGRIALLHALAHIELNAVDLAAALRVPVAEMAELRGRLAGILAARPDCVFEGDETGPGACAICGRKNVLGQCAVCGT